MNYFLFQMAASLIILGLAVIPFYNWLDRQDTIKLNNDPFAYLFGGAESFLINFLVMCGCCAIFGMCHLYLMAASYLVGFAIKWSIMAWIYTHVCHLKARGRFYGRLPAVKPAPKPRVNLYA
jgi:hypothetical protein